MKSITPTTLVLLGCASLASAATTLINVDFNVTGVGSVGPFSGTGPLGGGTWNNPTAARAGSAGNSFSASSLLDSTNVATTVGVSVGTFNNGFDLSPQVSVADSVDPLFSDYLYLNGGQTTATITLSGLGAGTTWNLVLFGANASAQGSTFTVGATTLRTTDTGGISATPTEGDEYVQFNNLVADGSGNITVAWGINTAIVGNTSGAFNGFQLQQVPEPSAALIGGLGLLGLLRRRR